VGRVNGGEEVLEPPDVVPADGHWWAETVLGEGEFEVEVSGKERTGQLSGEFALVVLCNEIFVRYRGVLDC
jgi:hypothetical protein